MDLLKQSEQYGRIASVLEHIDSNKEASFSQDELAALCGISPDRFQRVFTRWVGITPRQFLGMLQAGALRDRLLSAESILEASVDAGLASQATMYDLSVTYEGVTPGQLRSGGGSMTLRWHIIPTPFGRCFMAYSDKGLVRLSFPTPEEEKSELSWLRERWPNAVLKHAREGISEAEEGIFALASGNGAENGKSPLRVHLKGTNFQVKVWEALLRIPPGKLVTYSDIARMAGSPKAVRAAGHAVGQNPVSFLIPCHRVIKKMGVIHNYRWGEVRKRAMIGWEAVKYT